MSSERLSRRILMAAAITGALGVLVGAFGAHGLESVFESRGYEKQLIAKRLDQYDVGVRYHLLQSVMLLALAAVPFGSERWRRWALRFSLTGQILFSGSLYLLVLTNTPKLGMITPLGGLCLIFSWLMLIPMCWKTGGE
ncbi:MAG: DUF423 domain-containing protein [Rubripirellula sp.]|nr:DUF423 domain-containing protein [Rubripirellula sp.]